MAKIPKYEWKIDLDDNTQGVKVISLVDEPAMETDFIAFQKDTKQKPKMVKFEVEGYKQIVAGLSMIPDKEIPRVDANGKPYVGYFSKETIEDIRNKFHKEMMTANVNVNHEEDEVVDAYLIESFIINSDKQVEDLQDKGIEEAVIGAWFTAYKIEDEEIFEQVIEGELNGFSVELYADRILKSAKINYNNLNKKTVMSKLIEKLNKIIEEAKKAVNEFSEEEAEVTLERSPVPELEIIVEYGEIGEAVNSVVANEDGEESLEPVADGDYVLEDGRTLVVIEGVLSEIKEAEGEEEPSETEEETEDLSTETPTETTEEVKAETEEDEVVAEETEDTIDADGKKTLEELIDLSQDGYYTVEVVVEGGAFTYGAVYANTYKDLKFKVENFESKEQEIAELNKEVEELKAKIKEPIADPKLGFEKNEEKEEVDVSKLEPYQKILHKKGLPIV